MKLLRRSKSTAAAHSEKAPKNTPPHHHAHHYHYHHNHVVHPQHNRNSGGMVVNMVEGVPVVVGPAMGKTKKVSWADSAESKFFSARYMIGLHGVVQSPFDRQCKFPWIYKISHNSLQKFLLGKTRNHPL